MPIAVRVSIVALPMCGTCASSVMYKELRESARERRVLETIHVPELHPATRKYAVVDPDTAH